MYSEKIFQNKIETEQSEIKQTTAQQDNLSIPDLAVSLTPLGFVFIWAIILLILQKIRANLDEKMVFSINGLHKVPCKNCKFFSNNHYLKCAVKPDIVMTEEAINCSEYCPKRVNFSAKNLFG
ncbi:hypothetical protein VB711_02835 [Cronbergia sp. UHCC 0137]|uniref:hypothetical protein n=1 Tax=Cronbergia sp. UHCC 0137 TaxID=3110239 RepID=UPI002B202AA3|nr:hypothetical protein [Cronbergia sp. UHCC 0137]MEA5616777.1 hypothetical protein [Cronbergia sp. UHCC 0137]